MKTLLFVAALFITLAPSFVRAESTDCSSPVIIAPDGRITQSNFPQSTTYWYGIFAQAGHSYSVEFEPPADNYFNTPKVVFTGLVVFAPGDPLPGCHGTSSLTVTATSGYAPTIYKNGNGAGRRASFVAQTAGLYLISITNIASAAGAYTFRAVDTTLFNLRWSTWGGYSNQWSFMNVSDMSISGTLTIYDGTYQSIVSVQITIPAGAQAFRFSGPSDLNLPWNKGGYAIFTHNGPPKAIIADSYMISANGMVVTYTKFQAAVEE